MADISFSKCNFITAELNHDLYSPTVAATDLDRYRLWSWDVIDSCNRSPHLLGPLGASGFDARLGAVRGGWAPQRRTSSEGDDDLVKQIFGHTKDRLKILAGNIKDVSLIDVHGYTGRNISILGENSTDQFSSRYNTANIKFYQKPFNNTSYNSNLFKLLTKGTGPYGQSIDIFLVIDTGDDLVMKLKEINNPGGVNDVNINVIHTVETCADSATSVKKPDNISWGGRDRPRLNYPKCFSWYYAERSVINGNNNSMLSNYKIITEPLRTNNDYKMQQNWRRVGAAAATPASYRTLDARKDGSKEKALIKLKLLKSAHGGTFDNFTPAEMASASLAIQIKRSGDYTQIDAASRVPYNIRMNFGKYLLKSAPPIFYNNTWVAYDDAPQNPITRGLDHSQAWYKERTYFVTGDWPAFCYAAYRGVNAILYYNGYPPRDAQPAQRAIAAVAAAPGRPAQPAKPYKPYKPASPGKEPFIISVTF